MRPDKRCLFLEKAAAHKWYFRKRVQVPIQDVKSYAIHSSLLLFGR